MNHTTWVVPALGLGGIISLVSFVFHNNNKNDQKVARVYKRLDEYKDTVENKYTNKDICQILHRTVDEKLDKIDHKLDKLLNGYTKDR